MPAEVLILIGSESDKDYASEAERYLNWFGISCRTVVASAHRTPQKVIDTLRQAEQDGARVVIAMAGMAAHLPGVVAAHTHLPVIGVPLPGGVMDGLDALLSVAQMPAGVPVACMAVGKAGARNAAVLAARIIALQDNKVREKLKVFAAQEYKI